MESPPNQDRVLARLRSVCAADSLGHRLVIGRQVGAGGMGRVFEAVDEASGRTLAVKLVQHVRGDGDLTRFTAEAEILESLDHPAIVAYVSHGTTPAGEPYLAMEWLDGEDLGRRLERGPLSVAEAVALGRRLADGLSAAHGRGVIHRDLKPSNIVLVGRDVGRATIVDFGIARGPRGGGGPLTRTGELLGTPGYMAPEQVRGARDLDGRADLFALGCLLYHTLAGRLPFEGDEVMTVLARLLLEEPPPLGTLRAEVPPRLESLIAALIAKESGQRPAAAGLVSAELAAIAAALEAGDGAALAAESPLAAALVARRDEGRAGAGRLAAVRDALDRGDEAALDALTLLGRARPGRDAAAAADARGGAAGDVTTEPPAARLRGTLDTLASGETMVAPGPTPRGKAVGAAGANDSVEQTGPMVPVRLAAARIAAPVPPRRRRLAIAAIAAIGLGGAAGTAGLLALGADRRPAAACRDVRGVDGAYGDAGRGLDGVYGEAARLRIAAAFTASRAPYAAASFSALLGELDGYAGAWVTARGAACADAPSSALLARRVACLDDRRRALGALVGQLGRADTRLVERAVHAVGALPELSGCTDSAIATDPARDAVRSDLIEARVQLIASHLADGRTAVDRAIAAAHQLGDHALEAQGQLLRGSLLVAEAKLADAVDALASAAAHAGSASDAGLRIQAWTQLGGVLQQMGRFAEAAQVLDQAEAALRSAPDKHLEADLASTRGTLFGRQGKFAEAGERFTRAIALRSEVFGADSIYLVNDLSYQATVQRRLGQKAEALASYQRALELLRPQGEDHPDVARARANVAVVLESMGKFAEARPELEAAGRSLRRAYGDRNPAVADNEAYLATALLKQGLHREAVEHFQTSLSIYEEQQPGSDVTLNVRTGLAAALIGAGEPAEAERMLRGLLVAQGKLFTSAHPDIASSHALLADALEAQHRIGEAIAEAKRAREIYLAVFGKDHPAVAEIDAALARFAQQRHH